MLFCDCGVSVTSVLAFLCGAGVLRCFDGLFSVVCFSVFHVFNAFLVHYAASSLDGRGGVGQ